MKDNWIKIIFQDRQTCIVSMDCDADYALDGIAALISSVRHQFFPDMETDRELIAMLPPEGGVVI